MSKKFKIAAPILTAALALVIFYTHLRAGTTEQYARIGRQGDAQTFVKSQTLPGGIPATASIINRQKYEKDVGTVFDYSFGVANDIASKLDRTNPSSELSQLNANAGKGPQPVSKEFARVVSHSIKIHKATDKSFDIAEGGSSSDIKVDKSAMTITIGRAGVQINLDGIIQGYLADMLLAAIYDSNIDDAMVKVGGASRSIGNNIDGPWQSLIYDPSEKLAHRGISLAFSNLAIATVGNGEWSPSVSTDMKGVSVLGKDAATTNAIATAAYKLGVKRGLEIVEKNNYRCVIIKSDGELMKSSGL